MTTGSSSGSAEPRQTTEPSLSGRQFSWLARCGRNPVAWAAAGLVVVGGTGAVLMVHEPGGQISAQSAAYCGLVKCAILRSDATPTGQPDKRLRPEPTPSAQAPAEAAPAPSPAPGRAVQPVSAPQPTSVPQPTPQPSPVPPPAPAPKPSPTWTPPPRSHWPLPHAWPAPWQWRHPGPVSRYHHRRF
jgi:hypothetical protein